MTHYGHWMAPAHESPTLPSLVEKQGYTWDTQTQHTEIIIAWSRAASTTGYPHTPPPLNATYTVAGVKIGSRVAAERAALHSKGHCVRCTVHTTQQEA